MRLDTVLTILGRDELVIYELSSVLHRLNGAAYVHLRVQVCLRQRSVPLLLLGGVKSGGVARFTLLLVSLRASTHVNRVLRGVIVAVNIVQVADEGPQVTLTAGDTIVKV